MPPKTTSGTKRKAPLAPADSNIAPPPKKAAKGKNMDSAGAQAAVSTGQKSYKYSDPSSVSFGIHFWDTALTHLLAGERPP